MYTCCAHGRDDTCTLIRDLSSRQRDLASYHDSTAHRCGSDARGPIVAYTRPQVINSKVYDTTSSI